MATSYVILKKSDGHEDGGDVWIDFHADPVSASSAKQAVSKHAEKAGAGTYIAIPAKQFKPLTVTTETVTKVKVEIGGSA